MIIAEQPVTRVSRCFRRPEQVLQRFRDRAEDAPAPANSRNRDIASRWKSASSYGTPSSSQDHQGRDRASRTRRQVDRSGGRGHGVQLLFDDLG